MEAEFLPSCLPSFVCASATTMTSAAQAPGCSAGPDRACILILSQLDQDRKGEAHRVPLPPTYT
jgi:hypothetical protein